MPAEPDSITVLPGHFAVEASATDVTPGDPVWTTTGRVRTELELLSRTVGRSFGD